MSGKKGLFLVAGALAGFVAGLCLAPKEGSEIRKEAKEKFLEAKENPKDVLHETFEDMKEKVSKIKDDLSEEQMEIKEEDIVVSRSFNDQEGESK